MDVNLRGSPSTVLPLEDSSQVGAARRTALQLAQEIGFDASDAGRVALVATELASNILKHASRGALHLRSVPSPQGAGIELIAVDRGPGFDVDRGLTDGYSTGGTQGIGLGAVARLAQVFDAFVDARGAVILARLYARGSAAQDISFGVSQHALHGEQACGDAWHLAMAGSKISALVIDGLGHGPEAESAAQMGVVEFARDPFAAPAAIMTQMHQAMNRSRGGAAAIAHFDADKSAIQFVGIGNIGANLVSSDLARGLASHPGIVGAQFRKAHTFEYLHARGKTLIMYSDGLQSRWNLSDYPGLLQRHPAVITALLHRDFCRGRDDVTVLAVTLEPHHG